MQMKTGMKSIFRVGSFASFRKLFVPIQLPSDEGAKICLGVKVEGQTTTLTLILNS